MEKSNSSPTPLYKQCSACFKYDDEILVCSGCRKVRYCSSQCQRMDWAKHKLLCHSSSSSVTFQVSDKKPEHIFNCKSDTLPKRIGQMRIYKETALGEILATSQDDKVVLAAHNDNGLVGGILMAYNKHHNIRLRPEDFWCAILVQFSLYINANIEQLRSKFVDFGGKRELTIETKTANYGKIFLEQMIPLMATHIKDASIREWIVPSFSTTTPNDKVVFAAIMMSTLKTCFDYTIRLKCGIPNVTLLGRVEDYEELASRAARLLEFDNDKGHMKMWYNDYLNPIFTELIRAARGQADRFLWSRMCSYQDGGSGTSYISGWVTAFCCFDKDGKWQGEPSNRNVGGWRSPYPALDTNKIPPGVCMTPVKVVVVGDGGTTSADEYYTQLVGGSFVCHQVDDYTLAPRLDWFVAQDRENKK